ncbi:MAG TPA: SH3 domain-containing protein [Gammaproteobacteria bacterium]
MKKSLLAVCLLSLPVVAQAETGTVVRATQVLVAPYTDAASRGVLRGDQQVEIIERKGGWYRVTADDGREGWLRLSSIRLGKAAAEEEGGFWASLFSFTGRSQARTASATTGIRGLSETEIRDATPDPRAVERLATFYPDERDTRKFATDIGLQVRDVEPLDGASAKGDSK